MKSKAPGLRTRIGAAIERRLGRILEVGLRPTILEITERPQTFDIAAFELLKALIRVAYANRSLTNEHFHLVFMNAIAECQRREDSKSGAAAANAILAFSQEFSPASTTRRSD